MFTRVLRRVILLLPRLLETRLRSHIAKLESECPFFVFICVRCGGVDWVVALVFAPIALIQSYETVEDAIDLATERNMVLALASTH